MGSLDNADFTIETGGKAKFIRHFTHPVDVNGYTIDLSGIQFELVKGIAKFIKIFNTGSNIVFVAFDSSHDAIDVINNSTWNIKVAVGSPFSDIAIAGEASQISLKCNDSEDTTVQVIVW